MARQGHISRANGRRAFAVWKRPIRRGRCLDVALYVGEAEKAKAFGRTLLPAIVNDTLSSLRIFANLRMWVMSAASSLTRRAEQPPLWRRLQRPCAKATVRLPSKVLLRLAHAVLALASVAEQKHENDKRRRRRSWWLHPNLIDPLAK